MPIAVPCICLKTLLLKVNTFSFKTKLKSCFRSSLGMGREFVSIRAFKLASVPSSCGILRYKFDTSMVSSIALGGIVVLSNIDSSS